MPLDPGERRTLLVLARAALEESFRPDGALERALAAAALTPALREPRGAFVSLKRRRPPELRGCIGSGSAREPLYRAVIELVRKSAFDDPRFAPLSAAELPDLRIEISALAPLCEITGPEEIVIGRHGVELRRGPATAVFLPQVAVEQRWDVTALLRQLARKAGLAEEGWRGAVLAVFEAEIFGDPP